MLTRKQRADVQRIMEAMVKNPPHPEAWSLAVGGLRLIAALDEMERERDALAARVKELEESAKALALDGWNHPDS